MKEKTTEHKPIYRKRSFIIGAVAAFLVLSLLLTGLIGMLMSSPAVYGFGGATLREDSYSYWFSCLKYVYQVRYRDEGIEDTADGWAALAEDGRSYEEIFWDFIDEEIRLHFIAASLFDSQGYTLSESDHEVLDTLVEDMGEESFGDVGFDVLKRTYGVGKNAVKQVALYEQKYIGLYKALFSDPASVYSTDYRDALKTFYETYYYRYNMIYLPDSVGEDRIAALEESLWKDMTPSSSAVTGVTEEEFTALEKEYTDEDSRVTSGNYPNGIYLYAGENYENSFSAELLSAFAEANEIGKVVKKRNAADNGSYYVMRYALDDAPYLSEDEKVSACFDQLPSYAGLYLYRSLLRKELGKIVSHGVAETYTVAGAVSCKEHNVVQLLGNG